jgi:hypothetical protein
MTAMDLAEQELFLYLMVEKIHFVKLNVIDIVQNSEHVY